jgi:hypothetical protein
MEPEPNESEGRTAPPPALPAAAAGKLPPPDEAAYLDSRLMAELSTLNNLVAQHVLRFWDADAGRGAATSIVDELALAEALAAAANSVCQRARRRMPEAQIEPWTADE